MNILYLTTGNMQDILKMNFWRFKSIIGTLDKKLAIESGKPYIQRGLPQSTKDMIAKRKAQR